MGHIRNIWPFFGMGVILEAYEVPVALLPTVSWVFTSSLEGITS